MKNNHGLNLSTCRTYITKSKHITNSQPLTPIHTVFLDINHSPILNLIYLLAQFLIILVLYPIEAGLTHLLLSISLCRRLPSDGQTWHEYSHYRLDATVAITIIINIIVIIIIMISNMMQGFTFLLFNHCLWLWWFLLVKCCVIYILFTFCLCFAFYLQEFIISHLTFSYHHSSHTQTKTLSSAHTHTTHIVKPTNHFSKLPEYLWHSVVFKGSPITMSSWNNLE